MPASNKAAFLDRDGTIIEEKHYIADPAQVVLAPGAVAGLRALRDLGYMLVVVTNQSGIARGLYAESDFHAVQQRVNEVLAEHGIKLDGVYYCPHHPAFTGACECRKPGPGMYRQAERNLGVDLAASLYIGDRLKDVLPARDFGGRGILVRSGYGAEESATAPSWVEQADDLGEVAEVVKNPHRA